MRHRPHLLHLRRTTLNPTDANAGDACKQLNETDNIAMLYQYYASPSYIPPLPLPLPLPLFYLRLLSCIRRSILHGILFLLLGYVILFFTAGLCGRTATFLRLLR